MNTREKVLKEALNCVNGEREKQYGNPEDNFSRIADFWGLYLTTLFEDTGVVVELDPKDVAIMMILFKIARSLGDQDKLDNYVDIIGYGACAAEIFDNGNEDKMDEYAQNPYLHFYDRLVRYASAKAKEKNIQLENFLPRDFFDRAAEDCVSEGKYGGLKLLDYYKEIDELLTKYDLAEQQYQYFIKKNFGQNAELADKCKGCDYGNKCMLTGVCLKETEKKRVENGENLLDNFADLVNARVRKSNGEE